MTIKRGDLTVEVADDCSVVIEGDKITVSAKPLHHFHVYSSDSPVRSTASDIAVLLKGKSQQFYPLNGETTC